MSILNDVVSKNIAGTIKLQQQPKFPLRYDGVYGPYTPITSYEKSLQQDFMNLLMTNPGEWPMNPEIGIGLRNYLFELSSTDPFSDLEERISDQLDRFLPKIQLVEVIQNTSLELVDQNKAELTINYVILNSIGISVSFLADLISGAVSFVQVARSSVQGIDMLNREVSMISDITQL